jgi:hypothetical protein
MKLFAQIRMIGWAAIEAAFLLIVLCLLIDIVVGPHPGSFVSNVAKNRLFAEPAAGCCRRVRRRGGGVCRGEG